MYHKVKGESKVNQGFESKFRSELWIILYGKGEREKIELESGNDTFMFLFLFPLCVRGIYDVCADQRQGNVKNLRENSKEEKGLAEMEDEMRECNTKSNNAMLKKIESVELDTF